MVNTAISTNIYVLHELYRPGDAETVKQGLIELGKGAANGN
jgi:hypothetical protein